MSAYFSGSVDWFDDRAGRGYIIPEESEEPTFRTSDPSFLRISILPSI